MNPSLSILSKLFLVLKDNFVLQFLIKKLTSMKNSNYTKEERHEIYKKAKEIYIKSRDLIGICSAMNTVTAGLFTIDDFPELMRKRPDSASDNPYYYWWDVYAKELRIKVFDEMIEETKPEASLDTLYIDILNYSPFYSDKGRIQINIPEGQEIDIENSNIEKGLFTFKKSKSNEVLKWEDIDKINGYCFNYRSIIIPKSDYDAISANRNVFPTKEDAQSALALAQLLQVRSYYIGDWEPDWSSDKRKYGITRFNNEIICICTLWHYSELSFPEESIAKKFMNNNMDLLKTYFKIK